VEQGGLAVYIQILLVAQNMEIKLLGREEPQTKKCRLVDYEEIEVVKIRRPQPTM
jgi:hypothetical protein